MYVNGDDIRFADTVNCSTIPYWIESGINTSSTVIWIKMPTLAASSTKIIKMYYGNPNATAASNGDSTFMLFDDFTGSTLNTSKWKTYGSSNSGYAIIAGQIAVTAGTSSTNTIGSRVFVSSNSFSSPLIVEGLVTSTSGFYSALGILNSGTWDGYSLYYGDNTAGVNAGLHIGQDYSDDVDYASHIETTETNAGNLAGIWQLSWPTSNSQTGIWPGGTANANTTGVTLGSSVQITFGQLFTSIGTASYDWVRARQYAISDPTVQIGSEQLNHNSGIEDITTLNSVRLYPNPAYNRIFVDMTNCNENFKSMDLMDISGRVLQIVNIQQVASIYEIPLTNLSKGIYLIQLRGEDGLLTRKVVVN